ncbi:Cu,Zn superoxide dismutase-like protein [Atractiella rhizophila]|nr:Cu,Zn superoxide dismutase-like protein [Atractiella rhizophila]
MAFENTVDAKLDDGATPIYNEVLNQLPDEEDKEVFRNITSSGMTMVQQSVFWSPVLGTLACGSILLLPRMFPRIPIMRSYFWPTKFMAQRYGWTAEEMYARRRSAVWKTVGVIVGTSFTGIFGGLLGALGTAFLQLKDSGRSEEIMAAVERAQQVLVEREREKREKKDSNVTRVIGKMSSSSLWKTEFAVSMTCESCVQDCQRALSTLGDSIVSVDINLEQKTILVIGTAPPSKISKVLKETGRQVIVRGTGTADPAGVTTAAVAILENYDGPKSGEWDGPASQKVRGLARLLQAETEGNTILLDLTIKAPIELKSDRKYKVYVSQTGDLQHPPISTGSEWKILGTVEADETGYGDLFVEVEGLALWEILGRAMVIQALDEDKEESVWAGVIARSSGVWGNKKEVCSCSGLSMWEEDRLQPHL